MDSGNSTHTGKSQFRKKPTKPFGGGQSRGAGRGGGRGNQMKRNPGRKRSLNPAQEKQARAMVDQSGIPFQAAVKVVQGRLTLNEVLQQLLREEKIKKLIERYDINRALATNIALGRTDLEIVLLRRRKNDTLREHYSQSCLLDAMAKEQRIVLGVHGHKKVIGEVKSVDKYVFTFQPKDSDEPIEIHKTQAKFGYDPDSYKMLRKFMGIDSEVKKRGLEPILRAKERHHFKNLLLQQSIDERMELVVTTLEGDTFRGIVDWFGRWEFGLKVKGGAKVTIFRHAVFQLKRHGQ